MPVFRPTEKTSAEDAPAASRTRVNTFVSIGLAAIETQRDSRVAVSGLRLGSPLLVQNDAELFAQDCFDAVHVVLHENEFLLRIRKAFEEVIEGVGQAAQLLSEEVFKPLQPFIDSG